MDPGEIEFLAEKEKIDIIPNFTHGIMHLIQGILFYYFLKFMAWFWLECSQGFSRNRIIGQFKDLFYYVGIANFMVNNTPIYRP